MDPTEFEQQLASQQRKFELLSPLGEQYCHIRFTGPFKGELIIWDAYLQSLAYYLKTQINQAPATRQFIEVGEPGEYGRQIRIGLNLTIIDEPAILKTLVMIRQYKLLAPGRHEFGERFQFPK